MARTRIEDLPKDMKVSRAELESIRGGIYYAPLQTKISNVAVGTWPTPERLRAIGPRSRWGPVFQSGGGCGCGCG